MYKIHSDSDFFTAIGNMFKQQVEMPAKSLLVETHEKEDKKIPCKMTLAGHSCIQKIVISGTVIRVGQKIITQTELRDFYDNDELMILGLVQGTGELSWEAAPSWWRIVETGTLTLYHVLDPARRKPKTIQALPVNALLPYSYVECKSDIDEEMQEALDTYKAEMLSADFDVYYELFDKSGDSMKRGTCRTSFLDKLKAWAEDIGGFYCVEAIC